MNVSPVSESEYTAAVLCERARADAIRKEFVAEVAAHLRTKQEHAELKRLVREVVERNKGGYCFGCGWESCTSNCPVPRILEICGEQNDDRQ